MFTLSKFLHLLKENTYVKLFFVFLILFIRSKKTIVKILLKTFSHVKEAEAEPHT